MVKSTKLRYCYTPLSNSSHYFAVEIKKQIAYFVAILCFLTGILSSKTSFSQNFPPASSCTSNDLELVEAILPPNQGENACQCGGTRTLWLSIKNKTGSTRTSFAFWGTLEIYNADGSLDAAHSKSISDCFSNIIANDITKKPYKEQITFACGQSIKITNLYLAWTDANKKSVCPLNSANIAPKCGTLPSIQVIAGIDAEISSTNATCSQGGSITVSPYGGVAPYTVEVNGITRTDIGVGGSTTFTDLPATTSPYSIAIADSRTPTPCTSSKTRTITQSSAPSAPISGDDQSECERSPIQTLTATATPASGTTLVWYTVPTGGTSSTTAPSLSQVGSLTAYAVSRNTTTGCESARTTVNLQIKGAPGAPSVSGASECQKSPIQTLTAAATAPAGGSILWYSSATGGTGSATAPTRNTVGSSIYYAEAIDANGCASLSRTAVTLEIKGAPGAPSANGAVECALNPIQTLTATATAPTNGRIVWYDAATNGSVVNSPTLNVIGSTTYFAEAVGENSCPSLSRTAAKLEIKTTPGAPTVSVVNNCNGSSDLTASNYTGSLLWNNGSTAASIHVTDAATYTVTQTVAGCPSAAGSGTSAPKSTPSAPVLSKVDNCDGTTTITAKDGSGNTINAAELTWSNGATTNPISVSTTTAITATRTVYECTSGNSNSIMPAPKTTPGAPTVSVVNNCNGSSDLTASNYTGSLLWNNGSTAASIHVTDAATYTVTQTVAGCPSAAGSGTSAPKSTPSAPVLVITQPSLCAQGTTGSVEICSPKSGYTYTLVDGTRKEIGTDGRVVFTGLQAGSDPNFTVTDNSNGCTSTEANCSSALSTCPPSTEGTKSTTVTKEQISSQSLKRIDINARIGSKTNVLAAPNPFTDKVRFTLESAVSGKGSLEIYNTMGQRIVIVYEGYVEAGKSFVKEYHVQESRRANLVYVFRVGDQKTTGKLLNW